MYVAYRNNTLVTNDDTFDISLLPIFTKYPCKYPISNNTERDNNKK